jgi:hypothetical protein
MNCKISRRLSGIISVSYDRLGWVDPNKGGKLCMRAICLLGKYGAVLCHMQDRVAAIERDRRACRGQMRSQPLCLVIEAILWESKVCQCHLSQKRGFTSRVATDSVPMIHDECLYTPYIETIIRRWQRLRRESHSDTKWRLHRPESNNQKV